MPDPKLLDKLRKLRAMATSAEKVGNEEEAQAFANMVQTLLAKHKIDATDVEWEAEQREAFVRVLVREAYPSRRRKESIDYRKSRQDWETVLALNVARASSCSILIINGTAQFFFYGSQLDAEGAKEAFLYLRQAAEHLGERAYVEFFHKARKAGSVEHARGFKASWLSGFTFRLRSRYKKNQEALQSKLAGTALMRLTGALERVERRLKDEGVKETPLDVSPDLKNPIGYMEGGKAADRVRLQDEVGAQVTAGYVTIEWR